MIIFNNYYHHNDINTLNISNILEINLQNSQNHVEKITSNTNLSGKKGANYITILAMESF